ncbi:MAG TPA: 3-oxo-tetronate kinase [Burkholderiales bacterium]|nr:3-oxo-tetronate kinase [Burkholderiales bacterium]
MLLGCIADDFTGATDLANTLTRQGMSTVVLLGVPREQTAMPAADAAVIALKSRSTPARQAVEHSLAALQWLRRHDARQFFFKYCSTFDSTDAGNIGPVADALLETLRESFTVACPAFPANGRTVYQGHLFVGGQLLSESGMRNHPVTPMTDPLLTRVLQRQTQGRVALIPFDVIDRGEDEIVTRIYALQAQGYRYAVVDALTEEHLHAIGRACAAMKLVTGGSGIALGLPGNFRRQGLLRRAALDAAAAIEGPAAVLAGSCSPATQRQVAAMKAGCEAFALEAGASTEPQKAAAAAAEWARPRLAAAPVLIYSTADEAAVAQTQSRLGREAASLWFEHAFAEIARQLVAAGVRRLIVAGGETSGAVVQALGIEGLRIGPEIDPGVPWTTSLSAPPLALALKSGNFGADDFFLKALRQT